MRTTTVPRLVVLGAVLPLLLGATLGSLTTDDGTGTWAYPMPATAFLALSIGLAISHALIALGYTRIRATTWATLAVAGSAALAVCELASGLMASTDLDSPALTALDAGYTISSIAVLVGTLAAGAALRRTHDRLAAPLLRNGALLLVELRPLETLWGTGRAVHIFSAPTHIDADQMSPIHGADPNSSQQSAVSRPAYN